MCVTWLIHVFRMVTFHLNVGIFVDEIQKSFQAREAALAYVWRDSVMLWYDPLMCVTWPTHVCHMPHPYMAWFTCICVISHLYAWFERFIHIVTYLRVFMCVCVCVYKYSFSFQESFDKRSWPSWASTYASLNWYTWYPTHTQAHKRTQTHAQIQTQT